MDDGRKADLAYIDKELSRFDINRGQRSKLEKAKADIGRQLADKEIKSIRDRFIRATQAGDVAAIEKYGAQLTRLENGVKI